MLLREGTHTLRLDKSGLANLDWASVSAIKPSSVRVWLDDELVEDVFVGPYSPHTWWGNNPLLGSRPLTADSVIKIEVGPAAILRIEGTLVADQH